MRTEGFRRGVGSILLVSAIVISMTLIQTSHVHAMGYTTHQFITSKAVGVFSDNSFFSVHYSTINDYCTKPDEWKSIDNYERFRHWYHMDDSMGENEYYRGGLPDNWFILAKGVLPWAVEDNFNKFVQLLTEENWEGAAQLAGVISHYVEDAPNPLHATSDYNPSGNHGPYEAEVNYQVSVDNVTIPEYVPHEVDNVFDLMKQFLAEGYEFTGYTENDLNYWLYENVLWNDTIKDITESRLREDVSILANLWYTGMIRANLVIAAPTLTLPGNGAIISDKTPTFEWSSTVAGYQFEYATDNAFTTNVTIVKDLTTTSYTPTTPLADGTWYWRVRSGDNTTSVGLWSDPWMFTIVKADFELENLYAVTLDFDNYLLEGENLVAKFYDYSWNYQDETVVCSENIPGHVTLLENISCPGRDAIKRLRLVVVDNENNVISTIASFTVRRVDLETRFMDIPFWWSQADAAGKVELETEFLEIPFYWSGAPS